MTSIAVPQGIAGARSPAARSPEQARTRWRIDVEARALILVSAVLLAFGLATLYSASAFKAMDMGKGSAYFLLKQLSGVGIGVVAFAVAAKVDAEVWRKYAWHIMALAMLGMLITILPFTKTIAPPILGARRFLFGGSVQPSEFAKLAVVFWTAMIVVKKGDQMRRFSKGMLPIVVVIGVLAIMAALEPDLSVVLFFALQMGVVAFAAGGRIGHFVLLGILGAPVIWNETQRLQYVMERLLGFADAAGVAHATVNYQLTQSLIAVGSGGLLGVGFGEGRQQNGFLPLSYDDFIGSSIGEEWGFVGIAGVTILYATWGWLGFRIAKRAETQFQRLVAIGLTVTMLVTAYLHLGVVVGLLPTTGLTLPFISYGRSNLILSMFLTGILVNIGSRGERIVGSGATDPLAAALRRE
ncbi:MAG: FtsW/RodA/SpoVE family cell cycle protein [Gemmatimonadetes bacterium]|nr:FtsW/RodA/SpoVE family cell cycle protein [Gemmatimonadota bacterium]